MYGMQTFEMAVKSLLREGILDKDTARNAVGF